MARSWILVVFLFLAGGCAAPSARPAANAQYVNPVLDSDFPDPSVIHAPDGFYYAYATQTERGGRWINIQVARSPDLVHWQILGDALPAKPAWASRTQDFWAPDVIREGPRYIMYYSGKPDTSDERHGLCLGVATATSPAGPFVDMGHPLKCGEGFVNIDPKAFDDPGTGEHLLYWGSGFKPIKVEKLGPDRMSFERSSEPVELVSPGSSDAFPVLVEGAWVLRRGGYYYLFYSGDNCCGPKANYAVMVARSRSAKGPYETLEQATGKPHSIVLQKRGYWIAPGHNSIVTDAAGADWIVYHAVDARRPREKASDEPNTRRVMLIDRIRWVRGWPEIDGPSADARAAPVP
ncbi:MAG TPA: glycoside hydrolase family 43 protein [Sphingomicrobium sp.]|nr:glycoside hydrolase family 43 protein [Sphingomicrobium sp.]